MTSGEEKKGKAVRHFSYRCGACTRLCSLEEQPQSRY